MKNKIVLLLGTFWIASSSLALEASTTIMGAPKWVIDRSGNKCKPTPKPGNSCVCANANSGEFSGFMWVCKDQPKCPEGEIATASICPPGYNQDTCYVCMEDWSDEGLQRR